MDKNYKKRCSEINAKVLKILNGFEHSLVSVHALRTFFRGIRLKGVLNYRELRVMAHVYINRILYANIRIYQ